VEIRELRAFIAVAEEGSVSAAGRRLHVSQSAVSQTIQSLERQLGVRLLVRGAGGVTLTEAGTTLLRSARALIAQHDRALTEVTGQSPATLRVGVPLEFPGRPAAARGRGDGRRLPSQPAGGAARVEHRAARRAAVGHA
jgi:molybdate transport repressor ModE-like protein